MKFRFCIDRGGTFTDVYCEYINENNEKEIIIDKLLSVSDKYSDAPSEAIRNILSRKIGKPIC